MGFDTLLGNQQLKENLTRSLERGHISHFYLISGPEGSGKRTLARLLGAAILCREKNPPCLKCHVCRKVMEGSHPDFITVDDPEKKTVTVDLIRQARADMYIQPNESDHKLYLFPRAQDMGIPGQNALLKVLEEPPAYGVFLLLTDNPDKLLPTVQSRCTELKLQALPRDLLLGQLERDFPQAQPEDREAAALRSGGFLGQARTLLAEGTAQDPGAEAFCRAFAGGDPLLLLQLLVPLEKSKREPLSQLLAQWLTLVESALACRSGVPALSPQARALAQSCTAQRLYHGAACLKQAQLYVDSNVSPGAVCGYLEWALR